MKSSAQAIATIRELMQQFDITASDLAVTRGAYKRGSSPAKYRDPVSGATWSGMGRVPGWIAGKDRAEFAMKDRKTHARLKMAANRLTTAMILWSAIASAGLLSPSNLQECLIDRLSGAKNDTVAHELAAECLQRFGENGRIEKKTGMFAKYHSGRDCTVNEAKDTPSDFAAQVIEGNCYLLYEPGAGE